MLVYSSMNSRQSYFKNYYKKNKKDYNIRRWKTRGCVDDDFKALNEYFINCEECMVCYKKFNDINKLDVKCLDHCHETGEVRYICCWECNIRILRPPPKGRKNKKKSCSLK